MPTGNNNTNVNINVAVNGAQSVNQALNGINNNLNSFGNTASNSTNQATASSNTFRQSLQNNINDLNKASLAVAGLSASFVYLGKITSTTAAEFDREMRNINSLSQMSEESFKRFTDEVKKLTSDKSVTSGSIDLSKGIYQFISSGFEASQALQMVGVSAKSATAGLTTTETAVKALAGLMSSYNEKSLQDSIKYSDYLFKIVDQGVISYEQLAQNLGNVSAVASSNGVAFKEVGAAFIEMTRAGISASESQTAISGLIRALSNPSPEILKLAQTLKVDNSMGEYALKTKGLIGVLQDLNRVTGGSALIMQKLIPESTAAGAALTLTKNKAEGFKNALEQMNNSGGATEKALGQQSKSIAFEFAKVQQAVESLKIEYGSLLNDEIRPLIEYVKFFIDFLTDLDSNTKKIILTTGLWTVALGATIIALQGLKMALLPIVANPMVLAIAGVATAFYQFDETIKNLKNSTEGYSFVLRGLLEEFNLLGAKLYILKGLEKINLFSKVGAYIDYKKADIQNQVEEKDQQKIKSESLKIMSSFQTKKASGGKLDLSDYENELKALTQVFTFISSDAAKKANILARQEIKAKIELLKTEVDASKKAEKDKAIAIAENGKKILADAEKAKKLAEEAERENKRRIAQEKAEREKMLKDMEGIYTSSYAQIQQATLTKHQYDIWLVNKEFKERKASLDAMKKYHIDTHQAMAEAQIAKMDQLKKINDEYKKAQEKDLEDKKNQEKTAIDFITKINLDSKKINVTDKEKNQLDLADQVKSLQDNAKNIAKAMSDMRNIDGKKIFDASQINKFNTEAKKAIDNFKEVSNADFTKKDAIKNYENQVEQIKKALEDLGLTEDMLKGTRLEKEKDYWEKIKDETQKALLDIANLNESDKKDLQSKETEANKALAKNLRDKEAMIKDANKRIATSYQEIFNDIGFLSKDASGKIVGFLDLESDTISANENLIESFQALQEKGFKGLLDFAKNGGDLTSITGFASLIINQTKGMISAVTDNLRNPENFQDFLNIANQIADDFFNVITLGSVKATKNLFGLKDQKQIEEAQKQIQEINLKFSKDKEKTINDTYDINKSTILKTVKDEDLKNAKLKELEIQHQDDLFSIRKQKSDLDIQLTDNKLDGIKKWYKAEKEAIIQSEGNNELRAKKLDLLSKQYAEKTTEYWTNIEKLNLKLSDPNAAQEYITNAQIELEKINSSITDTIEKEKQRFSILQDLAKNLTKVQEDYFSNVGNLMSKYYDKEQQRIKDSHKAEYDNIKIREDAIKSNEAKLQKLNDKLAEIEAKFAKQLEDPNIAKTATDQFNSAKLAFKNQNSGLDYASLIRTPEDEIQRRINAEKARIADQYEHDGDLGKRSEALKKLALEQNLYWEAISKNITVGTKAYDEATANSYSAFNDFKSAVKDTIEVQKEYEIKNADVGDGVVNLKTEIEKLTDQNKVMQKEITNYNVGIQSELDNLTAKFKTSSGAWETDLTKVSTALGSIKDNAKLALLELDKIKAAKEGADAGLKDILKDPTQPPTPANIKAPTTTSLNTNSISNLKNQNETVDQYIARITLQDSLAEKARLASLKPSISSSGTIQGTADFSSSVPQTVSNNFASGSITGVNSAGIFDNGGALGWINPANWGWFADGGIANGPESGYPAMLHGQEAVINKNQADNLAYIMKMAQKPSLFNTSSLSSANNNYYININGTNLSEKQLTSAIKTAMNEQEQQKNMGYRNY